MSKTFPISTRHLQPLVETHLALNGMLEEGLLVETCSHLSLTVRSPFFSCLALRFHHPYFLFQTENRSSFPVPPSNNAFLSSFTFQPRMANIAPQRNLVPQTFNSQSAYTHSNIHARQPIARPPSAPDKLRPTEDQDEFDGEFADDPELWNVDDQGW